MNKELRDVNNIVLYDELCKAFKTADVVLSRVKYRKHIRPYQWSKALNDLDTAGITKGSR